MNDQNSMTDKQLHQHWYQHPRGKIQRGTICPACARYNARDIVCIGIAIQKNKVLLIKRGIEPAIGMWALPGGYLDWDESVEECVSREVKEETGLDTSNENLFKAYSDSHKDTDGRQNVVLVFGVEVTGEIEVGHEEQDATWFDLDALPDQVAFGHDLVINEYCQKIEKI